MSIERRKEPANVPDDSADEPITLQLDTEPASDAELPADEKPIIITDDVSPE
jgi:hypothetical protein